MKKSCCTSHSSNSGWAENLPADLAYIILDKLLEPIDHVHFAAICRCWRSFVKHYNLSTHRWPKVPPPMLMIPRYLSQVLYSLYEGKIYDNINLRKPADFSYHMIKASGYLGCGHGWLAIIDQSRGGLLSYKLVNPFTKAVHTLSHIAWPFKVTKMILSGDPGDSSFMVVAFCINNFNLAFYRGGRRGKHVWKNIQSNMDFWITDAIFYKGQVYAVERKFGRLMSFDASNCYNVKIHNAVIMPSCERSYLVESTKGELLHVRRFVALQRRSDRLIMPVTNNFKVYKLVFNNFGSVVQQVELGSLEDDALFVGDSQSMSVSASSFTWCRRNSIYYTSDSISLGGYPNFKWCCSNGALSDMGIFNLEDRTTAPIMENSLREYRLPAMWILPPNNGL